MARRGRATTALTATIVAVSASPATAAPAPSAHSSVIGGHPASIADFPSLAFVTGGRGLSAFSCSGTVIAPRVVLTAAHCVDNVGSLADLKVSDYAVTTGTANVSHPNPFHLSSVIRTITYPGFNPSKFVGDAGLLILSKPASVPAIPLAASPPAAETPLTIAGWGVTSASGSDTPAVLHKGEIRVQPTNVCEKVDLFKSAELQLCGLDVPAHKVTACFGDSGGPAIAKAPDGTPVEVGITSDSECSGRLPAVFTRVDRISEWVKGWIDAVESGAPEPSTPAAHLPTMRLTEANNIILNTLLEAVITSSHTRVIFLPARKSRQAARGKAGKFERSCNRLSQARIECTERTPTDDGREFFASTVAYAIEDNAVVVKGHYVMRRVSCQFRIGKKQRCTIYTQRG